MYDCEETLEANGHKHALQRFLLALGDPYKILRVVPVRGGSTVTLKADAVVFRKATQETYRAFIDLDPKQVPYPLTDKLRGKQYARKRRQHNTNTLTKRREVGKHDEHY